MERKIRYDDIRVKESQNECFHPFLRHPDPPNAKKKPLYNQLRERFQNKKGGSFP